MSNPEKIERAFFQAEGSEERIEVHFNPESLQFTVSSNLKNQGSGNSTKQYVSESTGKLTMDLVFDSTHSGEDIRQKTTRIAAFMGPLDDEDENVPPVVSFEWGAYQFTGMFESYKETVDYFSADGVPLRASVNLTISGQDRIFVDQSSPAGTPSDDVAATPSAGKGTTDLATKAGNPAAAKEIARSNGIDNMRFPGTASVQLNASASLQGPAGFASAGAGLDLGLGAGLDLGLGAGADLSAGATLGASLSAGVNASDGAFAGLKVSGGSGSTSLKLGSFLKADASASLGVDAGSVELGGSSGLQGSASVKADVGAAGVLKGRIEFDGG
jgi:hypothetical protein